MRNYEGTGLMAGDDGLIAPITAVTVFGDGARVARIGRLDLEPGLRAAPIGRLPATADPASVRVAVRGAALLNVEVRRRFAADPLHEETGRLRADVERLRDALQAIDDDDAAVQARLDFLDNLSGAAATALARAVGFGRATHDDLAQMAGYLTADTASAKERRRQIAARRRAAQRELEAAERRLASAEKRTGQSVEYAEVFASIEADTAGQAEFELSYHVRGASWRPLYDLTLSGERLAISYLAEIQQDTGEDWPETELSLSTARQGTHDTLPELRPWYIGRAAPALPPARPLRARFETMPAGAAGEAAPPPGPQAGLPVAAARPVASAIPAQVVAGEDAGAGVTYRVSRPLAVPSDANPHKTSLARIENDARLDHLVVPALAAEAYLRATVTNDSALLLLPGRARVFHESQFVGETTLETVAPGEEFELRLGVDDQIRVERKLSRRSTSKAVIGGSRTIEIGYEITVENHRTGQARVSVHDHVPVSIDAEIKVRLREASPAPAEQDDLGELTWDLTLPRGEATAIRYRFTVEHPAQVTVAGI